MKKVIITGSTGMVGKGVLYECLESNLIQEVLVVNRKSLDLIHPKLKELLVENFLDIAQHKSELQGYDACFYCMGISVVGLSEKDYYAITFSITQAFADTLYGLNPNMVFNYVSGEGTDSSERGRTMWARVKGKTENMIFGHGFKDAYAFRPGAIIPEKGIKSKTKLYNAIYVVMSPFFSLFKKSDRVTTTTRLGIAMINTLFYPQPLKILHNKNINALSKNT